MSFQFRSFWVGLFGLLVPLFLFAEQVFGVNGVVRGHLLDGRPIIEHEEIPGYMPAMTMAFNVKDMEAVAGLTQGDQVGFVFHVDGKASYADSFVVTGKEVPAIVGILSKKNKALKVGDKLPDFNLVNEMGQPINPESFGEQYTLMTFIFTRCPVPEFCPLLASKYFEVQSHLLGDEFPSAKLQLLSVTLDPEYDTPQILRNYSKRVGANPALWSFATGSSDQIQSLSQALQVRSSSRKGLIDHTLSTALISPQGELVKLWSGNRWNSQDIFAAIQSFDEEMSCCEIIC